MKNCFSGGVRSTRPRPSSRASRTGHRSLENRPVEAVGDRDQGGRIEPPPALVAGEHRAAARVEAGRLASVTSSASAATSRTPGSSPGRRSGGWRGRRRRPARGGARWSAAPGSSRAGNASAARPAPERRAGRPRARRARPTKSAIVEGAHDRGASRSSAAQTIDERRPVIGSTASGPSGKKRSTAKPWCGGWRERRDDAGLAVVPAQDLDAGRRAGRGRAALGGGDQGRARSLPAGQLQEASPAAPRIERDQPVGRGERERARLSAARSGASSAPRISRFSTMCPNGWSPTAR